MAIKIYRSSDIGAPTLSGQIGQFITFLDAILVNGYNSVSVTSLTRSGSTATATCAAPHGLSTGDVALIAGAGQADYNVEAVVTVVSGTIFTYDVANSPTSPATGTITAKRAPLGYTKAFTGSNKAAYRANDTAGLRHYLRVQDDGGSTGGNRECRLWGYEAMTDVDTGTGPYPTATQSSNGYFQMKSSTSDGTQRAWLLLGDGKIFYLFVEYAGVAAIGLSSSGAFYGTVFGDILSYKAGDAYGSVLSACTTANSTTNPPQSLGTQNTSITSPTSFSSSMNIARDFTGVLGSRYVGLMASGLGGGMGFTAYISYPHQVDNGFYINPVQVTQGVPSVIRGKMPGLYEGMHGRALNNGDIVENVQGLMGRKFMMTYVNYQSQAGHLMIDITGPWDS